MLTLRTKKLFAIEVKKNSLHLSKVTVKTFVTRDFYFK